MPLAHFALSLSFLISKICPDNELKTFEEKQDAIQKMLEGYRDECRKAAEQPPAKKEPDQKNRIKELGTQGTSHQQKQKQTEAMNRQRQEGEQRLKTQTLTMRRGTGEERERREEAR